jgi:cytochrome c553
VACETCHGAALGHPDNGKLPIPTDTVALCTLCHEAMAGRPKTQPQIVVAQHSAGQQCKTCHNPHAPKIAAGPAKIEGDVAAGRKLATAECSSCHGAKGISPNDTWPNLAGQNAAYLVRITSAYKSGDQQDVMMTPLAKALSDQDIRNLASYYAELSCAEGAPAAADRAAVEAGKALAKNCAACHGETGISANPAWPNFAGQKAGYLVNVLKAFRGGLRKDPMMAGVVRGLSDTDINNLAAYYATQRCQPTKR